MLLLKEKLLVIYKLKTMEIYSKEYIIKNVIGKECLKEMKRYLMVILTIINIVLLLLEIKTIIPVVVLCAVIGFIKGKNSENISDIFNLHKFVIKIESLDNIFELINSVLICTVVVLGSTEQMKNVDGLYIIIYSIILYRFLFYGLCKATID